MKAFGLIYHDVESEGSVEASGFCTLTADMYKLRSSDFCAHLTRLKSVASERRRTIEDMSTWHRRREPVLLTFDDGGVSSASTIAPLLSSYGWRGHFFVSTDYIGHAGFMQEEQIRNLRRSGHVVGSHSCSHPARMSRLAKSDLLREWSVSVARLSEILEERVVAASVPGGYYSTEVAEAASRAGIRWLFTSEPVVHSMIIEECAVLGRYAVRRTTSADDVASLVDDRTLARARQRAIWEGKKVVKVIGGRLYLLLRRRWCARTMR